MVKYVLIFLWGFICLAYADKNQNAPVVIEANSFEYDNKAKIAIYKNNVVVRKEDFTLWADIMKIYFDKNSKIKEIVAEGNVKFEKGEYKGKSEKATYNAKEEIIKLIGNAQISKGNNILEGDEIYYYMKEDKAFVVGKDKKVRTIIVPQEIKKEGSQQ